MLGPNCSDFECNDKEKCIEVEKYIFHEWVNVSVKFQCYHVIIEMY